MNINFTACEYLDFGPNYGNSKRQKIRVGETKLCWRRATNGDLVQFCIRRGRINSLTGCLNKENAACSDYKDAEHSIEVSKEEIEA